MQTVSSFTGAHHAARRSTVNPTLELLKKELAQGNVPFPKSASTRSASKSLPSAGKPASAQPKKKFKFFKTLAMGAAAALALKLLMNKLQSTQETGTTEKASESTSGASLDVTA